MKPLLYKLLVLLLFLLLLPVSFLYRRAKGGKQ